MKGIIKIFGLERSGTNYIEWLLKSNFCDLLVFRHELGWKHGDPKELFVRFLNQGINPDEVPNIRTRLTAPAFQNQEFAETTLRLVAQRRLYFVLMVKNPYSWYESLAKYQRFPLRPIRKDAIRRWSIQNRRWCDLHDQHHDRSLIMRYEDLLRNLPGCLTHLQNTCSLERQTQIKDCQLRIAPDIRLTTKDFDRTYFLEKKFLERYNRHNFENINRNLDPEMMKRFGYEFIWEPPDQPKPNIKHNGTEFNSINLPIGREPIP